jgi:hypothetical protein
MISESVMIAEIARHRRLGFDRERSATAQTYKVIADTIAELGAFGSELHRLAAKAGKTGLPADVDRFETARAALQPRDYAILRVALDKRLDAFRALNNRIRDRMAAGKGR